MKNDCSLLNFRIYGRLLVWQLFSLVVVTIAINSNAPPCTAHSIGIVEHSSQYPLLDPSKILDRFLSSPTTNEKHHELSAIEKFLLGAEESLDIAIYEMRSKRIQKVLLEALKKGISVRILAEPNPVGNGCDAFSKYSFDTNDNCQESALFTEEFARILRKQSSRKHGWDEKSKIRYFNKNSCFDPSTGKSKFCYQHGKMVIRDNRDVLISTGNFNDTGLCESNIRKQNSCDRDLSVIFQNSHLAKALTHVFEHDLSVGSLCVVPPKKPRPGNVIRSHTEGRCFSKEIEVDPIIHRERLHQILDQFKVDNIFTISTNSVDRLTKIIREAKSTIQLQLQYLKDPELHKAILHALKRKVRVEITHASLCHFNRIQGVGFIENNKIFGDNGYFTKWLEPLMGAGKGNLSFKLLASSIPSGDPDGLGYQHAKLLVVDDRIAWLGSTNGSYHSTHINREFGVVLRARDAVNHLKNIMTQDHANAINIGAHIPLSHSIVMDRPGTCRIYRKDEYGTVSNASFVEEAGATEYWHISPKVFKKRKRGHQEI